MDWFRHDLSAQQDIKIRKLIRECGYEGYGLYWHAVELLYQNNGYMTINDFQDEFEILDHGNFVDILQKFGLICIDGENFTCSRVKEELEKSAELFAKKSEAGKKGNEIRWQAYRSAIAHTYKHTNKHTDIHTNKEISKRFAKPTVGEITAYCQERANAIDPQSFYDFYESKGWRVGQTPMKDWKACIRTWEHKETKLPKSRVCNDPEVFRQTMNASGGFDL